MKTEKIGSFSIDGQLLVGDPCEENPSLLANLEVKPGEYDVFISSGDIKGTSGRWNKIFKILVQHSQYKNPLKFIKTSFKIGVDSGQVGFFNLKNYYKDYESNYPLISNEYTVLSSFTNQYKLFKKDLDDAIAKKEPQKIIDDLTLCVKVKESALEYETKRLKNIDIAKLPSTRIFYEIISDVTLSPEKAGVIPFYGAATSSGYGDGLYDLFVSKNSKGEIISSYISFIDESEIE